MSARVLRTLVGLLLGCGSTHAVALVFLVSDLSDPANRQYALVIRYRVLTTLLILLVGLVLSRRLIHRSMGDMVFVALGVFGGGAVYIFWFLDVITSR